MIYEIEFIKSLQSYTNEDWKKAKDSFSNSI